VKRWQIELLCLLVASLAIGVGLWAVQNYLEGRQDERAAALEHRDEITAAAIARQRVKSTRRGCRRANAGIRRPLYGFLKSAEGARRREARTAESQAERRSNLTAAREYQGLQRRMVRAAGNVGVTKTSAIIDCRKAYPFHETPFEGG
jgi:hypothetical protein